MKVWVYVEGPSDRLALEALWNGWRYKMKAAGWGIHVLPLDNKAKFLRKIGAHASEKLLADTRDLVIGLPDYYPNAPYVGHQYEHNTLTDLLELQRRLVREYLSRKECNADILMERFYPSALKHDLEMLLLAACDQLRDHLGTKERLGNWILPVENQNQSRPPKRVVEDLYRTKKDRVYRDTKDSVAVLSGVSDIQKLLYSEQGQLQCPVFKAMLDWLGDKTSVRAY